ncbi:MAG TPA: PilN domain-containing protein, partial [Gemmatimonadaceae bacterium]
MRIEVNLLPGAKRGKRKVSGGSAIDFQKLGQAIAAKFKDFYLAVAVGSWSVTLLVTGLLFMMQRTKAAALDVDLKKAVDDSTHFAVVMADRARAEARRDSALTQLNIIKAIDEDRYIWPHILDEISRALPPYTWLRTVNFTGTPQGTNPAAAYRPPPPDTSKKKKKAVTFELPRDTVRVRIIGRTVDLQAFTRFMRTLEESPFLGNVQFSKTEQVLEEGKQVTQFTLDVVYTRPDSSLLKRVP